MKLDITAYGFRSSFRDWASERTNFPSEVVEMALAHTIPNKVEAAYRRGNLLEKRRELMAAWTKFACPNTTNLKKANLLAQLNRASSSTNIDFQG